MNVLNTEFSTVSEKELTQVGGGQNELIELLATVYTLGWVGIGTMLECAEVLLPEPKPDPWR